MDLAIRPALPRDKGAVFEVIRTIWRGDDYLIRTFDDWVRRRRDRLYVAELDGRIVGVARLAWFSPTEAWLETLRVHPRFRRRGIAGALMRHRIELARRAGARRIAFTTGSENTPQLRNARRLGFRRVERLQLTFARAAKGPLPRRATRAEVPALWRLAEASRRPHTSLIHRGFGWRWQRMTRADLASAVRRGRCYVVEGPRGIRGFAIAEPITEERQLHLRALVGGAVATEALLHGLRAIAQAEHLPTVAAYKPLTTLDGPFRRAGYHRAWPWSAAYFERSLRR